MECGRAPIQPRDFKGKSIDGGGADWPIDYSDLAPYYEKIEREVGVCGNLDHLEDLPDGIFLPPVPLKCSDVLVQRGAAKLGVKVIHVRKSTLSRPTRPVLRAIFAEIAWPGCDVVGQVQLGRRPHDSALKTGKLEIVSQRDCARSGGQHVKTG